VRRHEGAEHGIANRADDVWSEENPGVISWMSFDRAGGDELLDEVDTHAARQEDVHGLGLGRAHLRQLGRVVELAELGIHLAGDRALVEALEAPSESLPAW